MDARLRLAPRRIVSVDVRDGDCPRRCCFHAATHLVRSGSGGIYCQESGE